MNLFFVVNMYKIKCLLFPFLFFLILTPVLSGCASGGCGLEGERPCSSRDYYIPGKGAWASRSESPGEKFLRELFFPKSKKHKTTIKNFDKSEREYATKMIRETLKNNQDGQLSKWESPYNAGIFGSSGPVSTNGNCREFISYVQNGYESLQVGGTACLENNEWLFKQISPIATSKKPPKSSSQVKKENEKLRKKISRLEKENKSKPQQVAKKTPQPTPEPKTSTSGSGFFVSKLGHVITNEHVVKDCKSVTVGDNANKQVTANVVETDVRNDLALLKISSMEMASANTKTLVAKLGVKIVPLASQGLLRPDSVELGEDVVVAGFPFAGIFSNTIKITKGVVSAKRGMGNDSGQFQIDAAVQKGSSGGPIYDEKGNIIGVVVSQLDRLKVAKAIGSLPENVNFGIKASTVKQFLNLSGLPSSWSKRSKNISTKDIAKIAENQTVMVMCHQ